jgi:hypothetical protein
MKARDDELHEMMAAEALKVRFDHRQGCLVDLVAEAQEDGCHEEARLLLDAKSAIRRARKA